MNKVIVEVRGGLVQEIYSDDPTIEVVLIDWDTEGCMPEEDDFLVTVDDQLARAVSFPTTPLNDMPDDTALAVEQAT